MLMRHSLLIACLAFAGCLQAAQPLPRATPESQGVASRDLLNFVEKADREIDSLHSVMIVRGGKVVAEGWWAPYDARTVHELYSLSKSFTSTAVGLAVAEGKLKVEDPVVSFFADSTPADAPANLKAMRVKDLLRMNTGHEKEPAVFGGGMTTKAFLAHPVPLKPGTRFLYNTPATFMLSAIVQQQTGQTVLDYLKPRLFEPLGIEDPQWGVNSEGISLGGYGLSVRTEDIAKFGQLYLRKGEWNGRQLLPAAWVEEATRLQTSNGSNPASDWDQGYGYQFWRSRHGAYRGDGAFGQYCLVLPAQDAVLAITAGVRDMQAVLNLVWGELLPAMKTGALPEAAEEVAKLKARLGGLTLRHPEGGAGGAAAAKLSGLRHEFQANDSKWEALALEWRGEHGGTLRLRANGAEETIGIGHKEWRKGRASLGQAQERAVAASGAWVGDTTFVAKICLHETPYVMTLKLEFSDGKVAVDREFNAQFGPTKLPRIEGAAQPK